MYEGLRCMETYCGGMLWQGVDSSNMRTCSSHAVSRLGTGESIVSPAFPYFQLPLLTSHV